jgi:RNA polymerase sigma-70 factor (ECF subfamily)
LAALIAIPCERDHLGRAAYVRLNVDQRGLVVRAQEGDHDAFTALVDQVVARLDSAARLILRDPDLARDAVQDSLIRAWRDLPGLRDPDRFDAWLHRITTNACLDLARRRRRVIEVDIEPVDMPAGDDLAGGVAQRELLDRAMRGLSPAHRAVIVLHYFVGLPMPEVATAMGTPLGTAQSRLHYALVAMRASVAPKPEPTPAPIVGRQPA